jgi:hypothetical protein
MVSDYWMPAFAGMTPSVEAGRRERDDQLDGLVGEGCVDAGEMRARVMAGEEGRGIMGRLPAGPIKVCNR